jgi:hypothetical protein
MQVITYLSVKLVYWSLSSIGQYALLLHRKYIVCKTGLKILRRCFDQALFQKEKQVRTFEVRDCRESTRASQSGTVTRGIRFFVARHRQTYTPAEKFYDSSIYCF